MSSERVEARLFRGLQDIFPARMMARQWLVDRIREVYESYGFVPLETPAIEHADVLVGPAGREAHQQIFSVSAPEEEALGLRFDLTVPLSRVVAQYPELPRPFRRYQVAPVWRADKPGPGRFREFLQFDLDVVGAPVGLADTEVIAAACDTLDALDVGGYRVRYSSRTLLNVLVRFAGLPAEQGGEVFRVLDKLDRVGLDKVKRELGEGYVDESGDPIPGLGLDAEPIERIERFLSVPSDTREATLVELADLFRDVEGADGAIAEVTGISDQLQSLGYGSDRVVLDVSIARGLAYYTGPIFEAELTAAPQFGSVIGGGRYDGLVRRFLDEAIPATGASIGVDRLLAALEQLGKLGSRESTAEVLVTVMDRDRAGDYLAMAAELRRAGIPTELYVGDARRIGKQLRYADKQGVPVCVICGSDEFEQGRVTVKQMEEGRRRSREVEDREAWVEARFGQRTVPRAELVETVRRALED